VVMEGEEVEVCASFMDTPLDRDVMISFNIDLVSASGEPRTASVAIFVQSMCCIV
jgi:hypothetical protein